MRIFLIMILGSLVLLSSCDNQSTSDQDITRSDDFAMYLVREDSPHNGLSFGSWVNEQFTEGELVNLDDLLLESEPIISDEDIQEYQWSTHTIVLTDDYIEQRKLSAEEKTELEEKSQLSAESKMSRHSINSGSILLNTITANRAVVITVGGSRIYAAGFELSFISSVSSSEIMVHDASNNSLVITNQRASDDSRLDKRIYNFFKSNGKLQDE